MTTRWCIGLLILFVLISNLYIYTESKSYIYDSVSEAPVAETALVLGAAVSAEGRLSPIFIDRADMAIGLYEAGKVSKILVSGDNSTVDYNEVNPVRLYLIKKGVPDEDIFLDNAGFDTYSSMYRARDVFSVYSILITTQSFHLPRSVFIARHLGIDAYGVNADVGHMLFRNYLREILANEKAIIDLVLDRKPKFLGDKISIVDKVEVVEETEPKKLIDTEASSVLSVDSGVTGKVLLGPICPGMRIPPDLACADKGYATTVQVIEKDSIKSLFASVKSDEEGNYTVLLPQGKYRIQALGGQPFPSCAWEEITVEKDTVLTKDLSCDTGIR